MKVAVVNAHGKALEELRKIDDVNWVYVSPAGDFQAEGERTGKYKLGGEELTLNSKVYHRDPCRLKNKNKGGQKCPARRKCRLR